MTFYPCSVSVCYRRHLPRCSRDWVFDTAPVTGSLLFYAPVCRLAVCCAAGISSWVLFGGCDCIWFAVFRLFFWRDSVDCVMATYWPVAGSRCGSGSAGRDERSVRALIPDPRVLERAFMM